jgi:hypothetical protein
LPGNAIAALPAVQVVSRILRLALLAPDTVEAVLAGRADQALILEQLERLLPVSWEELRQRLLSAATS